MPEICVNNDIDTYKSYSLQNTHASQLTREKNIILEKERQSKLIQPRELGKRTIKLKERVRKMRLTTNHTFTYCTHKNTSDKLNEWHQNTYPLVLRNACMQWHINQQTHKPRIDQIHSQAYTDIVQLWCFHLQGARQAGN